MLQYITNTSAPVSVTDQVKGVIAGGCRWIQIRMKNASDEEISRVVEEIMPLCLETESFLILDDRVELAKKLNVGGVHLGKMDMLPSKARVELGPAAVIGCTANTIDDVLAVHTLDIDYIGIGPYRFTETKSNLAPVLGIEGIRQICDDMRKRGINIPRVAIGGILKEDVDALMGTGINGIAVSGAIAFADDIKKETEEFLKLLAPYEHNGNK
ncbi:thiamine phosphate synthase [uncultured Duncaniella sp.]|uniref:thiamine phosphate synthase n=1 Tax=uncultured Duncaniella sp. TaxID=2768039 RepID=UPI0026F0F703|nr:thiamine phosphate synthase [uncultured Duncaniella sp.]